MYIHSKTRTWHDKNIQFDYCIFENGPISRMINRSNGSDLLDFSKSQLWRRSPLEKVLGFMIWKMSLIFSHIRNKRLLRKYIRKASQFKISNTLLKTRFKLISKMRCETKFLIKLQRLLNERLPWDFGNILFKPNFRGNPDLCFPEGKIWTFFNFF